MTKALFRRIGCSLAQPAVLTLIAVGLWSSVSYATVNPEIGKDSTPVVLKCRIVASSSHEEGRLTIFSASCEVMEVVRSSTLINAGDTILIRYGTDLQAVAKQYEEMERKVAEGTGWAGPALAAAPRALKEQEVIIAYLRPVVDASILVGRSVG